MGGEKQPGTVYAVLPYGSPPRMRGKEQGAGGRMAAHGITPAQAGKGSHAAPVVGTGGITPAWAGKSPSASVRSGWTWDHPRVGGEKSLHSGQ